MRGTTTAVASTARPPGGAGPASAHGGDGATANGFPGGSPGIPSGSPLQVPAEVPVNAPGDAVGVIAPPKPASGSTCVNT